MRFTTDLPNIAVFATIVAVGICAAAPASAQESSRIRFDLPAQPLGAAIRAIARASGRSIVADSILVDAKHAPALRAHLTVEEALARLLAGSGLTVRNTGSSFVIVPASQPVLPSAGEATSTDIVVTGTRIRGAPIASPVITLTAEAIRNEGFATLSDAARAIPQNFGGGQNPGIGVNVPVAGGVNVGSGTSLNLRGLGSDATLTLLNGKRLSYSSSRQSVDLSAIPAAAVQRIEIVADGASAIYGSDAVAGVANIILRRDAEGVSASARLGSSTDGGNFEQIYGVTAGARWRGGGSILAYEFGHNTAIRAEDRSYARSRSPGLDLFPEIERHNLAASVHQTVSPHLTMSLDGLYNYRRSTTVFPLNTAGDLSISRGESPSRSESFLIAPELAWTVGSGWRLELTGSYGEDRVRYQSNTFAGPLQTSSVGGCYCNDVRSIEVSGDGPIFMLPGGPARLALGIGYRENGFSSFRGAAAPQNVEARQRSHYVYGEASLPLISPEQDFTLADALSVSAALRYERYPELGSVVTPKIGLVYAPVPGLDLKASWGRSFRAPTLFQRYQPLVVALFPASRFGGSGLPPGATTLYVTGGRETLRPERAQSWSATAVIRPAALDGARLELSYFETRYRDRVVTPIGFIARALSDPIYRDQIASAPSRDLVDAVVDSAGQFLNAAGAPYDPAQVAAIIDNANLNAGRQRIWGLDALAQYSQQLNENADTISATLNASYLDSEQQLSATQPTTQLAGALFNPPRFRARATAGWSRGGMTLTAAVSHIGGVDDVRSSPPLAVQGMNPVDLTLRHRTDEAHGLFSHLDIVLTAQNLFNDTPDPIATTLFYDTPYDSTNYGPIGRFIAVGITKQW